MGGIADADCRAGQDLLAERPRVCEAQAAGARGVRAADNRQDGLHRELRQAPSELREQGRRAVLPALAV